MIPADMMYKTVSVFIKNLIFFIQPRKRLIVMGGFEER